MPDRLKFTKSKLLEVKPPASGRVTLYDLEIPKLALRITSAGSRTFYVIKRMGQSIGWVKLGQFPEMTVERARQEAQKVLAEFASGANPVEARRALRGEMTFGEAFEDFILHRRKKNGEPLAERTKVEYQNCARLHLGPLMRLKLSSIQQSQIARLHERIGSTATYMANRTKALVSSIYNHARSRGYYTGENPAAGVQGFAERTRARFAQQEEMPALFSAIEESTQRDYFMLSLLTGVRRSNLQAMQWNDVDIARESWHIPHTKNGEPQVVALCKEAISILLSRKAKRDGSPFVFPGQGKSGHLVEPSKAWKKVLKQAGIDNFRIHDLRRTFGSWLTMSGASLPIVGKTLNHKSHQSTSIYARLQLDPIRGAINAGTASMLAAAKPIEATNEKETDRQSEADQPSHVIREFDSTRSVDPAV